MLRVERGCNKGTEFYLGCLKKGGKPGVCEAKLENSLDFILDKIMRKEFFEGCVSEMKEHYASEMDISLGGERLLIVEQACDKGAEAFYNCLRKNNSTEVCIKKARKSVIAS